MLESMPIIATAVSSSVSENPYSGSGTLFNLSILDL